MRLLIRILLFNLMLFLSGFLIAGDEKFSDRLPSSAFQNGQLITIDDKYDQMAYNPNWSLNFKNIKVKNKIRLGLNPKAILLNDVSLQVSLEITSIDENNVTTTYSCDLAVDYSSNGNVAIQDLSTFTFSGGHHVTVEVTSISGQYLNDYFYLQSEIEVERFYYFDHTAIINSIVQPVSNMNDYIEIVWEHVKGAEEYEIEYVHINDYLMDDPLLFISESNLEFNFYRNSIRIKTSKNFHRLPTTFNRGHFIHRVRAIGRNEDDFSKDLNGKWNEIESGTINQLNTNHRYYIQDEYDGSKNWSFNLGLTEDGKRFEGLSYADGLGRVRQSVTHNTETNQSIVAPRYYDSHGREVITSLSVPEDTEDLSYRNNFNYIDYDDNGTQIIEPFTGKEYDMYGDPSNNCIPAKIPFSKNHGAGKYYSENNPDLEGENANIPNANGYPYQRVEYMNDQTGRIKRTGALGEEFQIGEGHETIYYYSTPTQEELIRLFGSEVGKAYQYQKRLMSDANGQIYVTYYDLAGRVVASGMLGENPSNTDALAGNVPMSNFSQTIIPEDLYTLANETNTVFYSKPEMITSYGTYNFELLFSPSEYTNSCMPANFCFDCVYEVNLKIIEDCSGDIIETITHQINGGTLDDLCNGSTSPLPQLAAILDVGMYQIERTITIVEEAKEEYWCSYLDNTDCVDDYFSIYNQFYDQVDFIDCEVDPNGPFDVTPDYNGPQECLSLMQTMLTDVSPNGQYALYEIDLNTGEYLADNFNLSLYNSNNQLNAPNASWRNPNGFYMDDQNTEALIQLMDLGSLGVQPEIINGASPVVISGVSYVRPQDLLHLEDFINFYKPYWSHALVQYHPEYCYYQFCDQNSDFHDYKFNNSSIIEHNVACLGGLYNPLPSTQGNLWGSAAQTAVPASTFVFFDNCNGSGINSEDLFFTNINGGGFDYLADLNFDLINYTQIEGQTVDLWSYAYAITIDLNAINSYSLYTSILSVGPEAICDKDQVWLTFRNLYNELRYKYYKMAELDFVVENECYSGCFGNISFNPNDIIVNGNSLDAYTFPGLPSITSTNTNLHCSPNLYANKIPRAFDYFGLLNQYPTGTPNAYNDILNDINSNIQVSCSTSCVTKADEWIDALIGCNFNTTTLASLRADLVAFCAEGCSNDYPSGISTLPLGSTSTSTSIGFNSFEDILDYYLSNNGSYIDNVCNIYLLPHLPPKFENPKELDVPYLDDCGCDVLFNVEQEFTTHQINGTLPPNVVNIETYYYNQTGIWMDNLDGLICACESYNSLRGAWSTAAIQNLLNEAILVPKELACNTNWDDCIDCSDIQIIETEIDSYFSGQNISLSLEYERIFMNYANSKLGFHLGESEYETFLTQCSGNSTDPFCEISEEGIVFKDMLNIIFKRGQIHTPSGNPIDLLTENIVYANSNFTTIFSGSNFWSCDINSCTGNSIDLYFGTNAGNACGITLTLPNNPSFGFEDIINIINIEAVNTDCTNGSEFDLYVEYFECGERQTAIITGISNCFNIGSCYCGTNSLLCDDPYFSGLNSLGDCYSTDLSIITDQTDDAYSLLIENEKEIFFENYENECKLAFNTSSLTYTGGLSSYQFTLFYYDQAGNLVKTVAPEGINYITSTSEIGDAMHVINTSTLATSTTDIPVDPNHTFETVYEYNSYNQLISTTNPDQEGETKYWYDRYGRIVASRNPEQAEAQTYSYVYYDDLGRPYETGQILQPTNVYAPSEDILKADDGGVAFKNWVEEFGHKFEITITIYDAPLSTIISQKFEDGQQNLRLRVASVLYYDELPHGIWSYNPDPYVAHGAPMYTSATHYSYDPHGNVVETLQDVPFMSPHGQDVKSTQYEFELISGNMTKVKYQKGEIDEFTHEYHYDQLNRLTEVYTSSDSIYKSRDAAYQYYDYGPLARTELGQYNVQGNDYAYTINGWLKGMNSNALTRNTDLGKDATNGFYSSNVNIHQNFAKDVVGFSLGYYDGDYSPIGGNSFEADYSGSDFGNGSANLYNGNIRHMVTAIDELDIQGYAYSYDQLQRLTKMEVFKDQNLKNNHFWKTSPTSVIPNLDYLTQISYDKNGNILTLDRNGNDATGNNPLDLDMDQFTYSYYSLGGQLSNRLNFVADIVPSSNYTEDIDNQTTGNYEYNDIGQLTKDASENMELEWRLGDHKLKYIRRTDQNSSNLEFVYNPLGVRVAKIEKPRANGVLLPQEDWTVHYYAYDANGQLMSTYKSDLYKTSSEKTTLEEQFIYGSSRVGVLKANKTVYPILAHVEPVDPDPQPLSSIINNELGKKRYELTNHLGNVLATISDRRTYSSTDGYYKPVVKMYADYYAFGMVMPDRFWGISEDGTRHLFNGMEADAELSGDGNSYTTEFRQYDPRLGRWKSLDPLMAQFPWQSPYVAFDNNPVYYTDPLGLAAEGGDERGNIHFKGTKEGGPSTHLMKGTDGKAYLAKEGDLYTNTDTGIQYKYTGSGSNSQWSEVEVETQEVEEVAIYATANMSVEERAKFNAARNAPLPSYNQRTAAINNDNINPGIGDGKIQNIGARYSDGRNYESCLSCHSPSGSYNDDMSRLGWHHFSEQVFTATVSIVGGEFVIGGVIGSLALKEATKGGANLVDDVAKQAKSWLGKDYKVVTNKAGDNIFMSNDGLRKMRFDIKNPHGDAPHIHLEIFKNGKWRDAIPGTHRIYPKP